MVGLASIATLFMSILLLQASPIVAACGLLLATHLASKAQRRDDDVSVILALLAAVAFAGAVAAMLG